MNNKKYEVANHISNDGDSIRAVPFDELEDEGITFYNLDAIESKIRDIVIAELDLRLGPARKDMDDA